jgi:hypothetical protein
MLDFKPMSQIISKIGNSLIETSGLLPCRKSISPFWQINSIQPIELHPPLIQTSKFLLNCQKQSAIGWDSWQPIKSVSESDRSDSISTDIHRFDDGIDLENRDIVTNIVESFELESGLERSIFPRDNKLISQNKSKQDNSSSDSQYMVSESDLQIDRDRDNLTADNQILSTNLQLNDDIIYEMAIDNLADNAPLSSQHRSLNIEQTPTLSPQGKEVGQIFIDVPRLATPGNLAHEGIISEVEVDNLADNAPLSAQPRSLNIEQTPTLSPQIKEVGEIFADVPRLATPDNLASASIISEVEVDNLADNAPLSAQPRSLNIEQTPTLSPQIKEVGEIFADVPRLATPDNLASASIISEVEVDNLADNAPLSAQPRSLNIEQTSTLSPQIKEVGEIFVDVPRLTTPDNLAHEGIISEVEVDNVPLSAQSRSLNIEQTSTLSPQIKEVGEIFADVPKLTTPDNLAHEGIISEVEVDNVPLSAQSRSLNIEQTSTLSPQSKEVGQIFIDVSTPEILDDLAHEGMIREVTPISPSTVDKQDDRGNLLPVKGYATGGQVTYSHNLGDTIHPSDTVSAMLTPKEFVVNVRDAQKNINLLEHINSGRELTEFIAPDSELPVLPSPIIKQKPTAQDLTFGQSLPANSLQLKDDNSLIYPSREREIDRHHISFLNNPLSNTFEHDRINRSELDRNYSSPSLIFRKPQSSTTPLYSQAKDPPSQWENIEDLLTGNNDVPTIVNLTHHVEFRRASLNDGNVDRHKIGNIASSPNIFAKHSSMMSSFTNGGQVISPDLATGLEPITETVEGSSSNEEDSDNSQELEVLAHEIYHRLRQRSEVERERQGIHHGRLPW